MPRRIYEYADAGTSDALNLISTVGVVHPRARRPGHGRQRPALPQARPARGTGPVEGQHARVVHVLATAAEQLRRIPRVRSVEPMKDIRRADRSGSARATNGARPSESARRWRPSAHRPAPAAERVAARSPAPSRARQLLADYFELTKPKVQSLLLLTTVATMDVAGDPSVGWSRDLPRRLPVGRRRRRGQPLVRPRHRRADEAHGLAADPGGRGSRRARRCGSASRSQCCRSSS